MQRPIFLDGHGTTPTDSRVVKAMMPYLQEQFGNPSSQSHLYGWEAEAAVKLSRETLAEAIGAQPEEIIFTSGASEANNLALKGVAEAYFQRGKHIITVKTEHRAVLEPCRYLESLGFEVTYLPIQSDGLLQLKDLEDALRPDTILVSVMAANNEIGVLQPLAAIGRICHDHKVLFHTDAAQAIGKIPLDVKAMNIDLMSLTAHKLYGPKGIGALYIRRRPPLNLAPQIHGGGQEHGLRSGTMPTHQIVGFSTAVELALTELNREAGRQKRLRNRLWSSLKQLDGIILNGHETERLPGSLNVSVEGVDGAALLLGLRSDIAVSSGSACASGRTEPSHVLLALGRERDLASASLRFCIGRFNTEHEIDRCASTVCQTIEALRQSHQSFKDKPNLDKTSGNTTLSIN